MYYSSTTPVLLRTTKYHSSTSLILESTIPVLHRYYKVLLQYHSVLQSTLLQHYSVLQSTLFQHCSVLHSSTPVQSCITKYYSGTTPVIITLY